MIDASEQYPRHNFAGWLLMPSPYPKCDAVGCREKAPFMQPNGEATYFACEGHMLALAKEAFHYWDCKCEECA